MKTMNARNATSFNILFVDDDPIQHFLVEHTINMLSLPIFLQTALSVDEAIADLSMQAYDLVMTDLNMPQKTGIDLIRHLDETNNTLPVVVLSSSLLDTEYLAIKKYDQVLAYWNKPLDSGLLLTILVNKLRKVA